MKTDPKVVEHADFCLPRPGEDEVRMESYTLDRTGPDGVTVVGTSFCQRCIECGAQVIDDRQVKG